MLAEWWVWIVLGVVLGVLEIMVPGFIFLGFAIGAALTGVLIGLGALGANLAVTILVFAILSVVAFLVLRRLVGVTGGQRKVWTKDINDG